MWPKFLSILCYTFTVSFGGKHHRLKHGRNMGASVFSRSSVLIITYAVEPP